ncbi:MAG: YXWGXW repeat-containing protein [Candidatus Sulfotelmatobacter sp.]
MRSATAIRLLLFSFIMMIFSHGAFAQIGVGISVSFGPPALPVYEQPICPGDGYLWTPGYWAYDDDDGYYWVPGTWVEAPEVGFLWTPGYWGWGGNAFFFHEGYWGPEVGFYGGINYGFGYGGVGYEGGRWEGGHFSYNTYVNHVNTTIIHNTYNTRVTYVSETHVSYNGGSGGIEARPTPQQESYGKQHHVGPVAAQTQHVQEARSNPELRATTNHGKPPIAATAKPADFKSGVVATREAGGEYKAPPANAARGNEARPGNEAHPGTENRPENTNEARPTTNNHASELQPHKFTPPNSGTAATDKKYQQQQDKLAAKQAQDHQKLQQQQEKEHQQAAAKNYNEAQKQQMEQHHTQQTQQLEQKHATQQKQMEQRQAPRPTAPKPESRPPAEKPH